jgi:hypothetical protein
VTLNAKFFRRIKVRTWIAIAIFAILLPIAGMRAINLALGALPALTTRWSLNDAQGTNVQDSTTSGNDGTLTNSSWMDPSRCLDDACLFFDGTTDYISRTDDPDFDFAGADSFTISTWFRHAPKTSGTEVIVAKFNTGDGDGGYKIQMEGDGDITCAIDNDDTTFPSDSVTSTLATYDDNAWHYIACVKNGTSSLTLYIDGKSIISDGTITSSSLENNETFYLGSDDAGASGFTGFMDEFRLYRTALTAAQIRTDYNFGATIRVKEAKSEFLSDGLLGYWKMDETSGNAADASGNGNTLVNNSTTPFTGAKFALGAEFDGSTDFFDATDNAAYSQTGSVTLTAWIIPDSVTGSHNIVGKWDGSNESYLLSTEGDELRMYVETGNHQTTTAANLAINTTYHVTGVYNASTRSVSLYVNGVLYASTTTAGTIPASITDDAGEFSVGAEDTGGTAANFFDGHIDDIRFYGRALNEREVYSLYNWAPGPLGYWPIDEGTGTSVADKSGNGNTGTVTGSSSPRWVSGKFGSAIDFPPNATGWTTITPANESNFDITTSITVEAWIKSNGFEDAWEAIVTKGDSAWRISRYNTTNFIGFSTTGLTNVDLSGTVNVNDGAWHHVVGVYDGANKYIYIDGELDISTAATGSISTNNHAVNIGENAEVGSRNFNGIIDDVKVYNYARSSQKIVEDMNGGHPAGGSPVGSQISYWKLNEQEGATSSDSVGSNHVTLTNSPAWATGKYNSAIDFEKDSLNYLTVSDNASLSQTSSISLSAWIKPESVTAATKFTIAGKGSDYSLEQYGDEIRMYIGSGNYQTTNSANLQTATWYHVVGAYNATAQTVTIYINGVATASTTTGTIPASITDGSGAFVIGSVAGTTINKQVGAGTDDGWDTAGSGTFNTGSPLHLGGKDASTVNNTGLRFTNITIPQGAVILGATLDFNENYGSTYGTDVKLKIYGDDQDDCATFGAGALPRDRTKTTAALDWDSNGSQGTAGQWYQTNATVKPPDASTIVKEIVDRGSWASGNDLCLIFTDDGSTNDWYFDIRSYEYTGNVSGPKLDITYAASGGLYDGIIDEVKLYSSALSPDQVLIDMNSGTNTNFGSGSNEADVISGGAGNAPVGYWTFNENVANTCTDGVEDICDRSGNGNDGDLTGLWSPGKNGGAAEFDGTNDNVIVDRTTTLEPSQITIEAWFKSPGHATNFTRFISHGSSTGGYELILFPDSAGGYLEFNLGINTTEHDVGSNADLTDNRWHHVAATYDGTTMYVYIDGVRQTDTDATTGSINNYNTGNNLRFGEDETGGNDYTGLLDEVKIYNYARTQAQISYDYNRGMPLAYWKLNENVSGNAQTLNDSSGSGITATTDDGANNTGMDCTVEAKYSKGCDLDGTDDFLSVSSPNLPTRDFTISVWFNKDSTVVTDTLFNAPETNGGNEIRIVADSVVRYNIDGGTTVAGTKTFTAGTWNHAVLTRLGSDVSLYVNGVLDTTSTDSDPLVFDGCNLYIGADSSANCTTGGLNDYWNGKVDEVSVFHYGMSAAQVKKLYNQNAGVRFGPNEGTP